MAPTIADLLAARQQQQTGTSKKKTYTVAELIEARNRRDNQKQKIMSSKATELQEQLDSPPEGTGDEAVEESPVGSTPALASVPTPEPKPEPDEESIVPEKESLLQSGTRLASKALTPQGTLPLGALANVPNIPLVLYREFEEAKQRKLETDPDLQQFKEE
jgi:hypothetical protein